MVRIRRDLVPGVGGGGVGSLDSARAESCRFRLGDFGVGRFAVSGSRSVGSGSCSRKEPFFLVLLYCYSCLNRTIYDVFV